jgi:hypothetical protein
MLPCAMVSELEGQRESSRRRRAGDDRSRAGGCKWEERGDQPRGKREGRPSQGGEGRVAAKRGEKGKEVAT